jgi:hypothetical protein
MGMEGAEQMKPDLEAIRQHATDGLCKEGNIRYMFLSDKYTFQLLDYIDELTAEREMSIDDFLDYVHTGVPNFAPYCDNADKNCVDKRGWCMQKKCKGAKYYPNRKGAK